MTAMAQIFAGGRADPNLLDELQTILGSKQIFDTFRYDIRSAIAIAAHPAATGNQDITAGGVSWRPKAAIVLMCRYTADGTPVGHSGLSFACIDAENQHHITSSGQDNVATNNAARYAGDSPVLFIDYDGVTIASYTFVDWVSGGIRLNWTAVDASNRWKVIVILFGGTDLRFHAGAETLPASGVARDVTAPGFKPNGVININNGWSAVLQTAAQWANSHGFFTRDEQRGIFMLGKGNGGASGEVIQGLSTDKGAIQSFAAWTGVASDFDDRGFTLTCTGIVLEDDYWIYLALGTGDVDFWLDNIDSPNSAASAWTVTDPGFKPQLLLLISSLLTSVDADVISGVGSHGIHGADAAGEEFSFCLVEEDAATTMNVSSLGDSKFLNIPEIAIHTNTEYEADSVSFTDQGFEIAAADIDIADGTTHKWVALAMERTL